MPFAGRRALPDVTANPASAGRWSTAARDHRPFPMQAHDDQAEIMSLLFAQNLSAIVLTIAAVITLFIGLRAARPSGRR